MKKLIIVSIFLFVLPVFAAAPDGVGPWADAVVTSSQGTMKNGLPVPEVRSNPDSAVGVAEETIVDGTFYSLGFGGSITLRFDNGVRNGVIVIESTNPDYPREQANIEVSTDGVVWVPAGSITQSGEVSMPESLSCVNYVRVTDTSNREDFPDEIADGYDVDGVQAANAESCPSITPTQAVTPTLTQTPDNSSNNNSNSNSNNSQPQQCTATKPGTPSITSMNRTSPTTVQITWSAADSATTYAISYGTSSGSYQFGVPSTGNVTSFTIGGLDPNATYYFIVRAINDCQPGDASGQSSTGGGQVLGASTATSTDGGQVLGASTDVLGATGTMQSLFGFATASLAAFVSFIVYRNRTHVPSN